MPKMFIRCHLFKNPCTENILSESAKCLDTYNITTDHILYRRRTLYVCIVFYVYQSKSRRILFDPASKPIILTIDTDS